MKYNFKYRGIPAALIGCFLLLMTLSCRETPKREIKTATVGFQEEGQLEIFRQGTDSLLTQLAIEIADNEYETQTGLMYRKSQENGQAMLFVFEQEDMHSFYMKNTEFPLDIIFIRADKTIGSIHENAQPFDEASIPSLVPVQYVLEVNAGLAKKWQLQAGDSIAFKIY